MRDTAAGLVDFAATWLTTRLGGARYRSARARIYRNTLVEGLREQGWDVVRFDPTPEPTERPVVAERWGTP